MAGTESTAKSITLAHYYILANPSLMAKLRDKLQSKPSEMLEELFSLPYMSAIAIEAHRLSFGLTGRNPRVAPNEEMIYTNPTTGKNYHIPPGTPVSTSTLLAHTNENIFSNPWAFNPDRWLGKEGQEKKKYMLSFGKGPRMCIGRELADAETYLCLKEMAGWEMELDGTDEGDVGFLHDYHVAHPRLGSLGARARVLGRRRG